MSGSTRGQINFQNLGGGKMKRGGKFFFSFLWGEQKGGGQLTFYSIFSGGKKYAGRYEKEEEIQERLINKPVHLGLSILELSQILMLEFWYDYVKPKYNEKTK